MTQQIECALTYNYGVALASETEKLQTYNADTTQVIATIGFKIGFQNTYSDSNLSNNSVTINLEKDASNQEGVELIADGLGNTYELITSILAPGHNPIETPDCNHPTFQAY